MELITDYLRENRIEYQPFFEECPNCGHQVSPTIIDTQDFYNEACSLPMRFFVLQCNRQVCSKYFIIEIEYQSSFQDSFTYVISHNIYPKHHISYQDEEIKKISPKFIKIYNQAKVADEMNLNEVSGPGYRKALEFLMTDYIIFSHIEKEDFNESVVKDSKSIVKLIKDNIDNKRIVSAAEKAFWIGNDQTHYEKQWMDLNSEDLKNLIELVIYHIKLELQFKHYEEKMTRRK